MSTWRLLGLWIRFNISDISSTRSSIFRDPPTMDVRLVLDKGSSQRQIWQLHHQETVVGRRRDCHLRIRSAEVSRRHCRLSVGDGYVNVEDLDSINGTFINGRRVVGKQLLRPGDHLEIGPLGFIVEYELSPSAWEKLEQPGMNLAAAEQAAEVLPVCDEDEEENALVVAEEGDQPGVLPVIEEDTEVSGEQAKKADSESAAGDREEPLPVSDEEAADWHLPHTNDLRDLLSQMEAPESRPRRRER